MDRRIAVVVASTGRPAELGQLIARLNLQTRRPDQILISVIKGEDLPQSLCNDITVIKGAGGLTAQRNRAMVLALQQADIIAFFDDDYLPSRTTVAQIVNFFDQHPDVVGANGVLLADGIHSAGVSYLEAVDLLDAYDAGEPVGSNNNHELSGLYGCNMAFRSSAIGANRFDEQLPLYGWQEDIDFAASVCRSGGRLVKTDAFAGVHRGVKSGRTSGKRLGYSQVINPIYLCQKQTMTRSYAVRLIVQNLLANLWRAPWPEAWIDRKGRLHGNLIGVWDLIRRRIDPMKVLHL